MPTTTPDQSATPISRLVSVQRSDLVSLARTIAAAHSLDSALVCAICEQESSWNPWAIRYEPAFFARYIAPMVAAGKSATPKLSPTEAHARAFSWGLMQVMGQVAREQNFTGASCAELCDPSTGLEFGCRVLSIKLRAAQGDIARALQLWNGGANANYAAEVLSRRNSYVTRGS
jgi:soluble lytic murein transglycosylase-like protein